MSIKVIKNVKVILDYWITPRYLGMIRKPNSLPVWAGRAPLTAHSEGELHHQLHLKMCFTTSTSASDHYLPYNDRDIKRLGPDTEEHEQTPISFESACTWQHWEPGTQKRTEKWSKIYFPASLQTQTSDRISRNKFPVLWDHFQGLMILYLKDKHMLAWLFPSIIPI